MVPLQVLERAQQLGGTVKISNSFMAQACRTECISFKDEVIKYCHKIPETC
jgi:hypothetical protein